MNAEAGNLFNALKFYFETIIYQKQNLKLLIFLRKVGDIGNFLYERKLFSFVGFETLETFFYKILI